MQYLTSYHVRLSREIVKVLVRGEPAWTLCWSRFSAGLALSRLLCALIEFEPAEILRESLLSFDPGTHWNFNETPAQFFP